MTGSRIIGVFFGILLLSLTSVAEQSLIVRLTDLSLEQKEACINNQYDIAAIPSATSMDLVLSQNEYASLLNLGYTGTILQTTKDMQENLSASGKAEYRTYASLKAEFEKMEQDHPGICKLYDIGDSQGKKYFSQGKTAYEKYNHDILALKVSDNVDKYEDEPSVLFCGEHHAREPISLEVCMAVLTHILKNYTSDPKIGRYVNNCQLWFVPLVNPDGHKVVMVDGITAWRKNIRDNNNNSRFDSRNDGVDINRNYGFMWGGRGTSGNPSQDTYRGPKANSEPEIQAMISLFENNHIVSGITYHSYSQLVLWPYGYRNNAKAPDHQVLKNLGHRMAQTIQSVNGSGYYTPKVWYDLYEASGIMDDYAYGEHGTFLYTIELALQFIPPLNQIDKICDDNLEAAMVLLDRITKSTLLGHAYARSSSDTTPLVGEVYIKEIDDTVATNTSFRKPMKTNKEFGAYYRMLPQGSYTVIFKPDDNSFDPITKENVSISATDTTQLDFVYDITNTITTNELNSLNNFTIRTVQPGFISVGFEPTHTFTHLRLYTMQGKQVSHYSLNGKSKVSVNLQGLSQGMYLLKAKGNQGQTSKHFVVID